MLLGWMHYNYLGTNLIHSEGETVISQFLYYIIDLEVFGNGNVKGRVTAVDSLYNFPYMSSEFKHAVYIKPGD